MWFVTVEYGEAAKVRHFNGVRGVELLSITICEAGVGGTGSTRISLRPHGPATEDQAREIGVRVANIWAEAWEIRAEPVSVEVRPTIGTPEYLSVH